MRWGGRILDLAGVTLFAIVAAVVFARCWSFHRPIENSRDPVRTAFCDFQDVVYYPTKAALAGVNPYDATPADDGGAYFSRFPAGNSFPVYAPLIFIFSLPFALLPLTAAEILYWLVNLGLLLGFVYLLLRMAELPPSPGIVAGIAALLLLSRPGHANFYFGAITLPMALAALGAWRLAERRPWLAAVCLAISLIKPTFGGPLFILLILRRNYRAAFAGLAIGIAANLAIMVLLLPHELTSGRFVELLTVNQAVTDNDPAVDPFQSASRIDFLMVAERLSGHHWPTYLRLAVTLGSLAIGGWTLRRLEFASNTSDPTKRTLSAALFALTIAICIYHNIYDALLAATAAIAAWRMIATQQRPDSPRIAWLLICCVAVPALNYFSSKQFLAALAQFQPSLVPMLNAGSLWTLLSIVNGLSLTIAWCTLIVMAHQHTRTEPTATAS